MTRRDRLVLVIAGSDPSGGAGLELDLKVLALLGVHGAAVASCHTLQSATGMRAVASASPGLARRQLALLRRDAAIGAVKIGMLPGADWIALAASTLARLPRIPSVYDPVFRPTIGRRTLARSALARVRKELLPRVTLLTPNAVEAAELLDATLDDVARDPDGAARALLRLGARAVLLKGGHLPAHDRIVDRLRGAYGERDFESLRRTGPAPRGTGCALAAAIAAGLLRDLDPRAAIARARRWLDRARAEALALGRGRPALGLVASAIPARVGGRSPRGGAAAGAV